MSRSLWPELNEQVGEGRRDREGRIRSLIHSVIFTKHLLCVRQCLALGIQK